MTINKYTLTSRVTVPAGVSSFPAAASPVTVSGGTSAAPGAGSTVTSQSLGIGFWLLSWTAALQTAAAGGDANNFQLLSGATLLAQSVNAGAIGSYPQAAVTTYLAATATVAVKNQGAGSAGSVYAGSLTATLLQSSDSKGIVVWTGPGSPAAWAEGFPVTFLPGQAIMLDPSGPLFAAIGSANLTAFRDGTDNVGHAALGN